MEIDKITQELFQKSRTNQIQYSSRVVPGCKPVIGVRIPELRSMAKQIAREDYRFFLENCPEDYYEQETLKAYVIGYAKDDIGTILNYADQFIPRIHDWAVNDSFCQNFSIARKNRESVWEWLQKYIATEEEFAQRVPAVLLMSHFLVEEYIDKVLDVMNYLQNPGYYTKMGVAWCVATAYAKFPEQTFAFLTNNRLSDWTYNKAIQKMRESYRVPDKDKEILNQMKRKVK